MTLKELIEFLEKLNPSATTMKGFHNPHSWRGAYNELSFEPRETATTAYMMLHTARLCVGREFTGYKGGKYPMTLDTLCHIDHEGFCYNEVMTKEQLCKMFGLIDT